MAAPSKTWTTQTDAQVDANSPITVSLMTEQRDNDIHNYEWIGFGYTPAQAHSHDGVDSAPLGGVLITQQVVTATAFVTKTTGATKWIVEVVGGGGGGGSGAVAGDGAGGGGGGTALVEIDVGNQTFAPGDVTVDPTNTIDLGVDVRENGDRVQITNTLSDPPAPLAVSTNYWVVGKSGTTIQLATSKGGAAIVITDQGTGINTLIVMGIDATVGSGGGGSSGTGAGTAGGTSQIEAHASATGGAGGQSQYGDGGAGGAGSGGFLNLDGQGGGPGGSSDEGGGAGGSSSRGGGGQGRIGDVTGAAGGDYGGGGAGGSSTSGTDNGGAGADGVVIVWEYA